MNNHTINQIIRLCEWHEMIGIMKSGEEWIIQTTFEHLATGETLTETIRKAVLHSLRNCDLTGTASEPPDE